MKKLLIALALAGSASPALAQNFPGAMIADFYMTTMSIPKGWTLSYKGLESGVQVFIMDRDLDALPQTAMLSARDQMYRLMCGDDQLKAMISGGTVVRADLRDKRNGRVTQTKGEVLTSCWAPAYAGPELPE